MIQFLSSLSQTKRMWVLSIIGLIISVVVSVLTYVNPVAPVVLMLVVFVIAYIIFLFRDPSIGLVALIIYCFIFGIFGREVGGLPFGIGIEVFLLLAWFAIGILNRKYNWKILDNSLNKLMLAWFLISVAEIANPAGASIMGWLQEIRSTALFPLLCTPLVFLLFNSKKKMDMVLILFICLSLLATLNGIKQLKIGLSPGEQKFLDDGGALTHLIWGQLRVFSFYSDAGQFGASQASFVLLTAVLALGPFKKWKRVLLGLAALLTFYGMLISGTRGALFALVVGAFFAVFLTKNIRVLVIGSVVLLSFLFVLKYTNIGNGNYQIMRLRTAVDPKDASLNVRFMNQQVIGEYLKTRPFGGGLGVIGNWGKIYNGDKFLSTIEPDSYWVKIWAMYGIVGFILWFSMIMFILGKCSGIIWKIEDKGLRYKNIAMLATAAGLFFCSYGNEVMNSMPSALVTTICFAFIYLSPGLDLQKKTEEMSIAENNTEEENIYSKVKEVGNAV